jgi:hypothetical protein
MLKPTKRESAAQRGSSDEESIKARAYALWEEEGRPHGKHLEHWRRASESSPANGAESPSPKLEEGRPAVRRAAKAASADESRGASPRKPGARAAPTRPDGR